MFDLLFNKSGAIFRRAEEDLERFSVLRELRKILIRDFGTDPLRLRRIDQGDTGSLESGSGEASAVNALRRAHGPVDGDQLRRAAFVVVNRRLTTFKRQSAEPLQIARFPGRHGLPDPFVFRIEMLGPAGKTGRFLQQIGREIEGGSL